MDFNEKIKSFWVAARGILLVALCLALMIVVVELMTDPFNFAFDLVGWKVAALFQILSTLLFSTILLSLLVFASRDNANRSLLLVAAVIFFPMFIFVIYLYSYNLYYDLKSGPKEFDGCGYVTTKSIGGRRSRRTEYHVNFDQGPKELVIPYEHYEAIKNRAEQNNPRCVDVRIKYLENYKWVLDLKY